MLIDELVAYIRQFPEGQALSGGTYDSNLSFVQALTEAAKLVPNAIVLASLPESEVEAGSQRGVAALRALEKTFGRVQALWKPVATEEAFEIVRRRLFEPVRDAKARDAVCRAFADAYVAEGAKLPARDAGGPLLRPAGAGLPDSPGGLRPALRGLDDHRRLPAHARRAEADGQGHLPAVEGRQQGPDDPARQPAAVRRQTRATS